MLDYLMEGLVLILIGYCVYADIRDNTGASRRRKP